MPGADQPPGVRPNRSKPRRMQMADIQNTMAKKREEFKAMDDMAMKDMIHNIHFHINELYLKWDEGQLTSKETLNAIRSLDALNKLKF
jgi:hypothetical protein